MAGFRFATEQQFDNGPACECEYTADCDHSPEDSFWDGVDVAYDSYSGK